MAGARTRRRRRGSELADLLATAGLPFALVLYLGFEGGGYDAVVRSEVAILAWWLLLVAVLAGLLPRRPLPRPAVAGLALLLALAIWTGLASVWGESAERGVGELSRVVSLLGIYGVALALQGPDGLKRTVAGVAAAITVIAMAALGSRLHPSWFPENTTAEFLAFARNRLNWPLNYWNGLAALTAIGLPLALALAGAARTVRARSLSAAAVPVLVLTAFLTLSRAGAAEAVIAVVALLALSSYALAMLPVVTIPALGGSLLIALAIQRDDLVDGLATDAAREQGDEMIALTVAVAVIVGLLTAALTQAGRAGRIRAPRVPRRVAVRAAGGVALVAAVGFLALGGPGAVADGFDEFKSGDSALGSDVSRFQSFGGNSRWQYWESALDAGASAPLAGIGPGTYEFWWAREGPQPVFARDAHSLYLETFAELGIVGVIILAAVLAALVAGVVRRLRGASGSERILLAGALAAMIAFLVAAAVDWAWELTVLPVAFLLIAAAAGPAADPGAAPAGKARPRLSVRLGVAGLAVAALAVLWLPLESTRAVRASEAAVQAGDLGGALADANRAADLLPFAATPQLQRARVYEAAGDLDAAAPAARRATEKEATNWRTWLTLARVEAARGEPRDALRAYREGKRLNPLSPLFAPEQP